MDRPGVVANRYELVRSIGRGGMGEVFEGLDRETRRRVAIKLIRLGPDAGDVSGRFRREILAMAQVTSKHVVAIHDAGSADGESYLVMEYLEGEDLGTIVDRLNVLPVDLALRLTAQVCEGLIAVHAAGIVHRDIKPSNLMLLAPSPTGGRNLKILDFGIARVRATGELTELTQTGAIIGSPLYMAPEQLRGAKGVDQRADVWALGILLYRFLSGAVPHTRSTVADQLITVCSEPAPPLQARAPWVSPELAAFVHRALAIDVEARLPTAGAFAEELRRWLPEGTIVTAAMLVARAGSPERPVVSAGVSAVRPAGGAVSQSLATAYSHGGVARPPPATESAGPRRGYLYALAAVAALATGMMVTRARVHHTRETADADAVAPLIGDMAPSLAHTPGAEWFAHVRARCTSLEVRSLLAASPPPQTRDGSAFATACAALAGDLALARTLLFELDAGDRAYGAGAMFELAHEMADRANNDPMVAETMRLVLEVWPDNDQAAYAAGLVEFQVGDPRAAGHLRDFVRLHPGGDGFTATANQLLGILAAPTAACGRPLRDPMGHPIAVPGC